MNGHTTTVVALLERGADVNARDKVSVSYATIQANINELILYLVHCLMPDFIGWPYCTSLLINEWPHSYSGSSTG